MFALMVSAWAYLLVDVAYTLGTESLPDGYISFRNFFAVTALFLVVAFVLALVGDWNSDSDSKAGRFFCVVGAALCALAAMVYHVIAVVAR